jgi:hypothetical protein
LAYLLFKLFQYRASCCIGVVAAFAVSSIAARWAGAVIAIITPIIFNAIASVLARAALTRVFF